MTDSQQFTECGNCGTIHYVINEDKAKKLKNLTDGFSNRDLKHCCKCGSKDCFSKISEYYTDHYSQSDKIQPIILTLDKKGKLI